MPPYLAHWRLRLHCRAKGNSETAISMVLTVSPRAGEPFFFANVYRGGDGLRAAGCEVFRV